VTDVASPRLVEALSGARASGAFAPVDLHMADMVMRRSGATDPLLAVALALAVKAVRLEHVCVVLDDEGIGLLWRAEGAAAQAATAPVPGQLLGALRAADGLVEVTAEGADVDPLGDAMVVLSGPRCYLRRYALLEQLVADRLRHGAALGAPAGAEDCIERHGGRADASQRVAVGRALSSAVSVIAGGPGTGKTTTVALLVEVAGALPTPLRVALAAPTGKAAARMDEAVRAAVGADVTDVPRATTVHRLLGIRRDGAARTGDPLDADVIVIDEASMVSLPLLASVLGRARADARVVLVGDPDQLASIEVGAVLADVVDAGARAGSGVIVARLDVAHRFADADAVVALAAAVRAGNPEAFDQAVRDSRGHVTRVVPEDRHALVERVVDHAVAVLEAARRGDVDAALARIGALGVLCATKRGDGSTSWWHSEVERRLVERGVVRTRDDDLVGRPLLVTRNDPLTGLTNGSVGVIVAEHGERRCHFDAVSHPLSSLDAAEPFWALTIHKSQGSEYGDVVISLPGPDSPILTRELVYTAVTRSRGSVALIAPPGSLEAALARRVARASGLAARLGATADD